MSLINDALKRARESQRKNPPPVVPPLMPAAPRSRGGDIGWIFPAVIFLLIVVAFFFITLAMARHTVKKIINAPEVSATQEVETVEAAAAPVLAPVPAVIGVAAISNLNPAAPVRLQGIFYDPVHPSAIISGRTVFPGDLLDGMRVTAISRSSITLAGNGQTNTLVVGQ
jgi:hypothetical protein